MAADAQRDDVRAIEELIARQFSSLSWAPDRQADWDAFAADFSPAALLHPAARPARHQTVPAFVERMKGLAGTTLASFREVVLGTEVRVFGNVAVALAACEFTENDAQVSRGIEMLLLLKDEGVWRIAAQAWDKEGPTTRIPEHLLGGVSRD